jgi:hypothetical protein
MRFKTLPAQTGSVASVSIIFGIVSAAALSGAASSEATFPKTKLDELFSRRSLPEPPVPLASEVSEKDREKLAAAPDALESAQGATIFSSWGVSH